MVLELCSDLSATAWLEQSATAWPTLVTFGPSGYAAYARLRFLADPEFEGQPENEAQLDVAPYDADQWPSLLEHLSAHTRTPEDCFFCLWDGWPRVHGTLTGSKLVIPAGSHPPVRGYFVFRGPLADFGLWGSEAIWPDEPPTYEPAFIWPADHSWCVANDVDRHYAGIGGSQELIEQLTADSRLDAVVADPSLRYARYG